MLRKVMQTVPKSPKRSSKPASSPKERENQLIAKAYDLAEERIMNGTATSQEVCFFLKLGSSKEQLEQKLLDTQVELAKAKAQALRDTKDIKELYETAQKAMLVYQGRDDGGDDFQP